MIVDGQGAGPLVQFRAGAVAAHGVIDFVEVIQIAQAVAGDVAQLHKAVTLGIDTVVQQGQHRVPQGLDLGDGGQDRAADQSTEPPGPVLRDKLPHRHQPPFTPVSPARWMMPA